MRILFLLLLMPLCGCSATPLHIPERLSLINPEALIIEGTPPQDIALSWQPTPIEDFIISQNADGFSGRNDYQDIAVGRLVSQRVEDYIGTFSKVASKSDNRATVTIESARLNYRYAWKELSYAKLLINAEISINGQSNRKIYYQQILDRSDLSTPEMFGAVFDRVATEIGQDILTAMAR